MIDTQKEAIVSDIRSVCTLMLAFVALAINAPNAMAMGLRDESQIPQKGVVGKVFRFQLAGRNGSPPYNYTLARRASAGAFDVKGRLDPRQADDSARSNTGPILVIPAGAVQNGT